MELVSIIFCILTGAVIAVVAAAAGRDAGWLTDEVLISYIDYSTQQSNILKHFNTNR